MKERLDVLSLLVKLTTSSVSISLFWLISTAAIARPLPVPTAPPVRSQVQKPPSPPPAPNKEAEEEEKEPAEATVEEPEEGGGTESISPK